MSGCLPVKVKWQKQLFNDLELNNDEPPLVFKAQLMALTGVQVDRQKVMFKGKVIGDNSWDGINITNVSGSFLLVAQ